MTHVLATPEELRALIREAVREELAPLRQAQEDAAVTITEAARRLGVSPRTIQREIRAGRLRSVAVGRTRRVPLSALMGTREPG